MKCVVSSYMYESGNRQSRLYCKRQARKSREWWQARENMQSLTGNAKHCVKSAGKYPMDERRGGGNEKFTSAGKHGTVGKRGKRWNGWHVWEKKKLTSEGNTEQVTIAGKDGTGNIYEEKKGMLRNTGIHGWRARENMERPKRYLLLSGVAAYLPDARFQL